MWIICFSGGLGNQMFQYAFYKSLEKRYPSVELQADISYILGPDEHNGYELENIFNIRLKKASKLQSLLRAEYCRSYLVRYPWVKYYYKVRKKVFGIKKLSVIPSIATEYMPEIYHGMSETKKYIFMGYWINDRYLESIKSQLLKEFAFKPIEDKENSYLMKVIRETESVSIHVRRTDYFEHDFYHLSSRYYRLAMEEVEKRVQSPVYFIFSDDSEFAKKEFSYLREYYVVENNRGKDSFRDMQLMSNCKHNILANSTFSFWGGYLNRNVNKIVVEPTMIAKDMPFPKTCENSIRMECI